MSSGLKGVVHKRVHKERHQPEARKRFGSLEKHKDYVKRAKDFHRKEDALKTLHKKAYYKNEDEFAFGMLSHNNDKGKVTKKKDHLTEDELRLADSQDARYIGMREQMDKKAVQKRSEQLHFLDAPQGASRHVVFLDDEDEQGPSAPSASSSSVGTSAGKSRQKQKLEEFDVAGYFDTHPALLAKRANRLRLSQLEKGAFKDVQTDSQAYRELFARQERAKRLGLVKQELDLRQCLRSKGRRMKVSDKSKDQGAVYKWFPERKK